MHFRTKKQLALLVFLHFDARNHPVARDGLVDLLWPEVNADKGRHSLSQALSAVRAHLGDGAVSARTETVGLVAPLRTELDQLGAGSNEVVDVADPLRDLDKCAGADFAHWVDSARERLLSAAREQLAAGLREARSRGDLAGVARLAALLHHVDPVSPAATIALAERALLDGDTIGAIRMLRDYVRRVEQELGGNPHPEIATLLRRLEQGGGPAIEPSTPLAQFAQRRREVFVGREAELARLEGLWQRGREESLVSCLVTGVAGIGKSSLVRRFATSVAARTNPVFVVTCQEIGGGIPFAAVSDLMLAIGRDPAAGGTEPLWLAEASRVSPGLRALYPGIPEPPQAPAESVRLRVAEALVRLIESVAERRAVLMVFDDVQHMDPASRDVLFLFTRRLEQLHALVVATLRTEGDELALPSETRADTLGWQDRLELEQLDGAHVTALIDELMGNADANESIRNTIVALAHGNPYHAEMLVTDWRQHAGHSLAAAETAGDATVSAWKPPETLRLALVRQYKGLSTDAQHVLHVLAVAQKSLATQEIAGLLRIGGAPVERSVLELVERGFVRVDGGRYAFKNELHRAYVYYAMAVDARRYYHARLGQASWGRRDDSDFQWALEASHHFIRSGMGQEGVDAAVLGAELALARGAPREASRALQALLQAYPQDPQSRVHLLLARAHLSGGDYRATLEALARYSDDPINPAHDSLAAGLRAEALHRGCLGDGRTIIEATQAAVRLAERAGAEETLVRALQVQAEAAVDIGDFTVLALVREAANELAAQTDRPECRALAGVTRGFAACVTGEFHTASKILAETVRLLEKLSLHADYRRAINGLGLCWTGLGHFNEAALAFERAIATAQRLGDTTSACFGWNNLLALYNDFGMFSEAVSASHAAMHALSTSSTRITPSLYANMATLAMQLGNLSEAELFCQECERRATASHLFNYMVVALLERADLYLARSMPELAWPLVEEALGIANGRERTLSDMGQYQRLRTHYLWATKGYQSVRPLMLQGATARCCRKVDALEIQAFDAWVRSAEGDDSHGSTTSAISDIEACGMFGVLARLLAVGVPLPGIPEREDGESSAQLVARLFPVAEGALVPTAVGLAQLTSG